MRYDCWTDNDYNEVLEFVEKSLWLFVQQNADMHRPKQVVCNLTQLDYAGLKFLQRIYFLLADDVQRCIRESVPYLLKHLSQSTDRVTNEIRGSIRGNVDWSLTTKRRLALGLTDPTVFVTRKAVKTYDLPEMQALKYFLTQVNHLCVEVLGFIPEEDRTISYEHYEHQEKWRDVIRGLYHATNTSLKNIYMHSISLPKKVTDLMLQRVRCARSVEFKRVYKGLQLYRKLFVREKPEALRDCCEQGVLKPLNRDTLYEIYILFLTIETLEQLGWQREHLRLVGYGDGAVVHYKNDSKILRVYYQTLPVVFSENSLYTNLMRTYSVDAKLRRPDMLFEFGEHDFKLLEVKRTQNKHYIVESVYKVLGYLKDFEKCFEPGQIPQAVLVIWNDIGDRDNNANDIMVICGRWGYKRFLESNALQ